MYSLLETLLLDFPDEPEYCGSEYCFLGLKLADFEI
jgi:hypothetical protein